MNYFISEFQVTLGDEKLYGSIPSTGRRVWKDENIYDVYEEIPDILKDTISYKMPSTIDKWNSAMSFKVSKECVIFLAQHIDTGKRSYERIFLEEKGFIKNDENLVIKPENDKKQILEIWQLPVFEQFDLPKFLQMPMNSQHAVFVKSSPQISSIATSANDNLKNVFLVQKKTRTGEFVNSKNKLEKFPSLFEETFFYFYQTAFNLIAKEDIYVYIVQDKKHRGYFENDLKSRDFHPIQDIEEVETTHYNLNDVWQRNMKKEDHVRIPSIARTNNYPIIFVKKI